MPKKRQAFKHNIVAIIYDFDGTLTEKPMQEYTVLPKIGIPAKKFWDTVNEETKKTKGEQIVTYMRLMLKYADNKDIAIKPADFRKLAKNIKYYPGVEKFFERINKFVDSLSNGKVELRHYIISAGLKEILNGIPFKNKFHNIFASEYHYDKYYHADFPKIIVNDTLKTQFIFRINKGREKMHESINTHMSHLDRAIPFRNMLYIGDGESDVPCMTVIKKEGGYAIAVCKKGSSKGINKAKDLLKAERVDFITRADYSKNSELEKIVKIILRNIVEGITFRKEIFKQYLTYIA
ncbi:MAG: HAD family hydrolase [Candidatus Omnitrophica bacterium]|nr:HAD family hydrolase [Candidatus Omnitrophota bacterium]MDD5690484.1 HAD family hydrolase [Candidatus Omnitrophota bacterium]